MTNIESDKTKVLETYPGLSFKAPKVVKEKSKAVQKKPVNMNRSGNPNPVLPGGRPKGTPNKTTIEMRDFWETFCKGEQDNLKIWIKQIAEQNPGDAFKLVLQACEYFTPKIARTELTSKDGAPLISTLINQLVSDD